jgi:uncharacterized protein with NRDE domain
MCIMAMAWRAHPRWRLILAGNRDEMHARPAAPLARWTAPSSLIGGRDLQSGGAWLGLTDSGRCAIVTNRRGFGLAEPGRPSRGMLVADLLNGHGDYADPRTAAIGQFNPFNLIFIDHDEAHFLTNRPHEIHTVLTPGVYGLSNGALDEPWPKTLQLKSALLDWLTGDDEPVETLFGALRSENLPAIGLLPDTPSDVPDEAAISPIFINDPVYGTRCSTVIAIDANGHGSIIERRFSPDGAPAGDTSMEICWAI